MDMATATVMVTDMAMATDMVMAMVTDMEKKTKNNDYRSRF